VPWNPETGALLMYHHTMRYAWAMQFVGGLHVVDLGCGCGYGSFMLSWAAKSVVGLDLSPAAVDFAQRHYAGPNVEYRLCNVEQGPVPQADLYVAFEMLEHLVEPLALLEKLCAPLVWSVPVLNTSTYHKHVYSEKRVRHEFNAKLVYYQMPNGLIVHSGQVRGMAMYMIGYRDV